MADKYVNAVTGLDTNSGDSASDPYLTVQKGYDEVGDGDTVYCTGDFSSVTALLINDSKDVTIDGGDKDQTSFDYGVLSGCINVSNSNDTTFKNITVETATNVHRLVYISSGTADAHLTFEQCKLSVSGTDDALLYWIAWTGGTSTRSMTFTDCELISPDAGSFNSIRTYEVVDISFTGCTLTVGSVDDVAFLSVYGTLDNLTFQNNTITCSTTMDVILLENVSSHSGTVLIDDNIMTDGSSLIYVQDAPLGEVIVSNNHITSSMAGNPIHICINDHHGASNFMLNVLVQHNTIIKSNDGTTGHGMMIGYNATGARVQFNRVKHTGDIDWAMVIKADYGLVEYNVIYGNYHGLYFAGTLYGKAFHNTVHVINGYALMFDADNDGTEGNYLTIAHNIFSKPTGYSVREDTVVVGVPKHWNMQAFNNVYYPAVWLNGASRTTMTTIIAQWEDAGYAANKFNDKDSVIQDPKLTGISNLSPVPTGLNPSDFEIMAGAYQFTSEQSNKRHTSNRR